jgi:hypothetical protein
MEVINMQTDFTDIQSLLLETTDDQPMTFRVMYQNELCVVKDAEYDNSVFDYIIINECKEVLGLNKIDKLRVFRSRFYIAARTNEVFRNAHGKYKQFYIMKYIENSSMISDDINMLKDICILKEYVKIALFRAIFRVTDFCSRNVLIANNKLYSIDENVIGKQCNVIKKRDINQYTIQGITQQVLADILEDMLANYTAKLAHIKSVLCKYKKKDLFALIEYHFKFIKQDAQRDLATSIM